MDILIKTIKNHRTLENDRQDESDTKGSAWEATHPDGYSTLARSNTMPGAVLNVNSIKTIHDNHLAYCMTLLPNSSYITTNGPTDRALCEFVFWFDLHHANNFANDITSITKKPLIQAAPVSYVSWAHQQADPFVKFAGFSYEKEYRFLFANNENETIKERIWRSSYINWGRIYEGRLIII